VLVLSKSALDAAESDVMRADCMVQLARANHALGNHNEAMTFYGSVRDYRERKALFSYKRHALWYYYDYCTATVLLRPLWKGFMQYKA
jgi:hypothetical protein